MNECVRFDKEFEQLKEDLALLQPYYLSTRYADLGETEKFNDKQLAEEAVGAAERIWKFVKDKIRAGV